MLFTQSLVDQFFDNLNKDSNCIFKHIKFLVLNFYPCNKSCINSYIVNYFFLLNVVFSYRIGTLMGNKSSLVFPKEKTNIKLCFCSKNLYCNKRRNLTIKYPKERIILLIKKAFTSYHQQKKVTSTYSLVNKTCLNTRYRTNKQTCMNLL